MLTKSASSPTSPTSGSNCNQQNCFPCMEYTRFYLTNGSLRLSVVQGQGSGPGQGSGQGAGSSSGHPLDASNSSNHNNTINNLTIGLTPVKDGCDGGTEWTVAPDSDWIQTADGAGRGAAGLFLIKKEYGNTLQLVSDPTSTSTSMSTSTSTSTLNGQGDGYGGQVFMLEPAEKPGMFILVSSRREMISLVKSNKEGDSSAAIVVVVPYQDQPNYNAIWKMESCSGELVFISNLVLDKRIRCECDGVHLPWLVKGGLSLTNHWYGWDVWRMIETYDGDGSVYIASWTHPFYLASDSSGAVYKSSDRYADKWVVEKKTQQGANAGLLIRSVLNDRILCVDANQRLRTIGVSARTSGCLWTVSPAHRNTFAIASLSPSGTIRRIGYNQKDKSLYLTSTQAPQQQIKRAEEWNIKFDPSMPGKVTIRNMAGGRSNVYLATVVTVNDVFKDTTSVAVSSEPFGWNMDESPHGGFYIVSPEQKYLTCNTGAVDEEEANDNADKQALKQQPQLALVKCNASSSMEWFSATSDGATETWWLEPRLPNTMTTRQRNIITASIVSGVAITALAPVAILGMVGAMGLEAGAAAGGAAAAAMSAETAAAAAVTATATSGGLVAGGASVLGVAGTTAAVAGGAMVGGTVVGTTGLLVQRLASKKKNAASSSSTVAVGDPTTTPPGSASSMDLIAGGGGGGNTNSSTNRNFMIHNEDRPFANWENW